jgi:malate dehydrogenase (oxaloacetate-decarboxylating)(NADP+)
MGERTRRGLDLVHDPSSNKGTAFTDAERDSLGLRGLLPPRVFTLQEQVTRVMENLRRKPDDLEKYIFMSSLQTRNQTLFYRVLLDHLAELMPIVYTPTVGQACQQYGEIFRKPRGLHLTTGDSGRVKQVLQNWPQSDIRVVVVTDGERILGLGDLGANGMGIPVGKLALYTACAGIHPAWCLPVTLDVGTDNERLREDPLYIGLQQPRERGPAYDALVEEFVEAVRELYPNAVLQLEDFGNANAFRLLERYRDRACVFDDDIQGTAAVTLSGIHSALRLTRGKLTDQRLLFFGAGEAGIGIGDLVVDALVAAGQSVEEARSRCWFMDSRGLVVKGRSNLTEHKLRFAHEHAPLTDYLEAVKVLRPTALIGVSGQPQIFSQAMVEQMTRLNERPIIFALSNPTSKSECTAQQAYGWSAGRAVFASGSPFMPVTVEGRTVVPGQANNAYIFPGVGLGAIASGSRRITDEMFSAAARALSDLVGEDDLAQGRIFPALERVREVSTAIAVAVAEVAFERGLASLPRPIDVEEKVRSLMYEPNYRSYVPER